MSQTKQYRQLLDQLRDLLPDYLAGHGIQIKGDGTFRCLNPEHEDKNPSCGFVSKERTTFKCFACSASGDIFHAAHLLEGKPLVGKEFITENVRHLSTQFSIPFPEIQLSDKQMRQGEIFRAYEQAGNILKDSKEEGPLKKAYGWSLEEIHAVETHVGTVPWDTFVTKMRELGDYNATYLEQIGITSKLFDDFRLTFAIRTSSGHICGFVSRDTRDKTGKNQPKWCNTPGTVAIFEKGKILYGMDSAKTERGPIFLVEGYADALTLRLKGIKKVVAYMGSAPTANQITLLEQKKCTDIVLVPDWDASDAGAKAVQSTIESHLSGREDFNVLVKQLPPKADVKSYDPFDFIQDHSAEDFLRLPDVSAFDWVLGRLSDDLSPEEKCEKMFKLIVAEPNALKQEQMITDLAAKTEIRLVALRRDLDRRLEEKKEELQRKLVRKVDQVRTMLEQTDPKEIADKLRQEALELEEIQGIRYSGDVHGPDETRASLKKLRQEFWDQGKDLKGWRTGFRTFDDTLGGIPKKQTWITVAADGNVGKSAIVQNIALQVAVRNENVAVLFMTIDDTFDQTMPRLVAQLSGIKIGWVEQPQRYPFLEVQNKAMNKAWAQMDELIDSGKLDIKDASQGISLSFAESWIDEVRDTQPGTPILFVLDNFHLLSGTREERERVETNSRQIALIAKQKGVSVITTMELRKREQAQKRPRMADLKGSKKLEYDANVVIMVHSELHAKPDHPEAQSWVDDEDPEGLIKKPVLQLWIDKNKVTSFKGLREMKFKPDTCQLYEYEGRGSDGGDGDDGVIDD